MMQPRPLAIARVLGMIFTIATVARASAEPAPAATAAPARRTVLALIVTNNRSEQLGRPDLRYADDDGAKYYELFRTLASADQVALLTELDADTAHLFPSLRPLVQPPTRAHVAAAAERLAARAAALHAQGVAVDFYFIFAGHGDVDRGRGFIALADGAVNGDELEALVFRRFPAASLHLILDSCNAFFVINPRKPGGRRFPTPEDAAVALSQRLPNAGVFLSTSAEAEVYEWSELQSGIFSHAVRSGLAGAADANGDGRVSYSELAAFVSLASRDVRNPLYRPTVFARGPGGNNEAPLLDWSAAATPPPLLELPAGEQRRFTVRDADALPWIDVHVEADSAVRLRLPPRLAAHVAIDLRALDDSGRVVGRLEGAPAAARPTLLAELAPRPDGDDARGPNQLFAGLFTRPFGPRALAAWRSAAAAEAPPALGIALEDVGRMRLLLGNTAAIERNRRRSAFVTECLGGGVAMGMGAWILASRPSPNGAPVPFYTTLVLLADGLYACLGGIRRLTRRSPSERIFEELESNIARPGVDQPRVVAKTEERLFRLYHEERAGRRRNLIQGWALAAIGSIGLGLTALHSDASPTTMTLTRVALGFVTAVGVQSGIQSSFETPVERMVRVWAEDPGIQRVPRVGLYAAPSGAGLSLSGRF